VVSHVTPIKLLVADALGAPIEAIYRMELAPASISSVQWWPDGGSSLRNFSLTP
jgi:probable phosphoglycerate mutase